MAAYLLLDKDRNAVNAIEWDAKTEFVFASHPEAVGMVQYDGPFYLGGLFDGTIVSDPHATPPPSPQVADGEAMNVIA